MVTAINATAAIAYWIAFWLWPEWINAANGRLPSVRVLLSGRTWIIFGLLSVLFLVIDGAYRVKRNALGKQARLHRSETESLRGTIAVLETRLADALSHPKISGAFQDINNGYYFDETNPAAIFPNPLGTQIIISLWLKNDNPTPTTIHNFALRWEALGKAWIAPHAEEITPHEDRDVWATGAQAEENKTMVNLASYLGDETKLITREKRAEGYLVFRFAGLGVEPGTRPEDMPGEGWSVNVTLFVEDAWGTQHPISDLWARRTRPALKLSKTSKF